MSVCNYKEITLSEALKKTLANAVDLLIGKKLTRIVPGVVRYEITPDYDSFIRAFAAAKVCTRNLTVLLYN